MSVIFTVYIIYNLDRDKIYIGKTTDVTSRLNRHNKVLPSKKTSYTYKNTGRWIVIYVENYNTNNEASQRERWLKSGRGREFIKENLNDWLINSSSTVDPPSADS